MDISNLPLDLLRPRLRRIAQHILGTSTGPGAASSAAVSSAQSTRECADDASIALFALLEALAPEARTAFLLREAFDTAYPELAATLGRSEAECRMLVDGAKARLREQLRR